MKDTRFDKILWIGVLIVVIVFALARIYDAMHIQTASSASLPARELLLGETDLPEHWYAQLCLEHCERSEGIYQANRSFLPEAYLPSHAYQEITLFPTAHAAQNRFDAEQAGIFQTLSRWDNKNDTVYRSTFAEHQDTRCSLDEIPTCHVLISYQNYYVHFFFNWAPGTQGEDGLTLEEISLILKAFDRKLSTYVEHRPHSTTMNEKPLARETPANDIPSFVETTPPVVFHIAGAFPLSHRIGHPGEDAIDESIDTYWEAAYPGESITLRFDGRKNVSRIEVYIKQTQNLEGFRVTFSDGTFQEIELNVAKGWNVLELSPKSTVFVALTPLITEAPEQKGIVIYEVSVFGHN